MDRTTVVDVQGITDATGVAGVTEAVETVPGVLNVSVELRSGTAAVTVLTNEPLDRDAVRAALTDAGYEVGGFRD